MTEDQLRRIEGELQVTLPEAYRAALRDCPRLSEGDDPYDFLYRNPESVIGMTRSPLGEYYDGHNWRPSYLSIATGACGDQYFIDLARDPSPVFCLSHEDHEITEDFADLAAYVAEAHREMATIREQREQEARRRSRRWWPFG